MAGKKQKKGTQKADAGNPYSALLIVFLLSVFNAFIFQEIFSSSITAAAIFSQPTWIQFVELLGGSVSQTAQNFVQAEVPYLSILLLVAIASSVFLLAGAFLISRKKSIEFQQALTVWANRGWRWWSVLVLWQVIYFLFLLLQWESLSGFLLASLPLWIAFQWAGWISELFILLQKDNQDQSNHSTQPGIQTQKKSPYSYLLLGSCGIYVLVYTFMNWGLYWELLLPHGDSAMYEEHLWNVTHGKGFRSYLDQGLFFGEHIQFIHLFLLPFHIIWPSQLTMELCESVALAAGAIPVYFITRRHTKSDAAGFWVASGYLLYFPLQFLDIAIDLKTFRPIGFGIPVLLFALDQLERKKYKTMVLLFLVCLSAKEDYAIVIAPLGLWIAIYQAKNDTNLKSKKAGIFGLSIATLSTAYLLITVAVILPWFRSGAEIHYVGYFSQFGDSLGEVIGNIINPLKLFPALFNVSSLYYLFLILVPLGFLPLFSFSRFAVCLPLLALLCLNQIAQDPRHHFHAPLIPILFWAASAGLKPFSGFLDQLKNRLSRSQQNTIDISPSPDYSAIFLCMNCLMAGLFLSISPAGIQFWDAGSEYYWKKLYLPGKRAEMFSRIEEIIPLDSKVSSTDFVHPRYTHHDRSYDYSNYSRAVNENRTGAPEDTDYIVIDTTHRYSDIKKPEDIPEYRDHPEEWELLPDTTEGYFIILKRKSS